MFTTATDQTNPANPTPPAGQPARPTAPPAADPPGALRVIDIRCDKCHRLLGKAAFYYPPAVLLEIACPRCYNRQTWPAGSPIVAQELFSKKPAA